MSDYEFVIADVFAAEPFGGNQLAVLPAAEGLRAEEMQRIAQEFGFAETTFVLPPERAGSTARLRIFSPSAELPFAGHPTVGSAAVLAHLGIVETGAGTADVRFEEGVGPVDVAVTRVDGLLSAELLVRAPLRQPPEPPDEGRLAAVLGVPEGVVRETWFASVGLPFCFCRLAAPADVDAAELDLAAWRATLGDAWSQQVFVFAGEARDGAELYARMFAPGIGIVEDAATGSACAALVAYAGRRHGGTGTLRMRVRQGVAMGRPSVIDVAAGVTDGHVDHVTVAGTVRVFATGRLQLSAPPG